MASETQEDSRQTGVVGGGVGVHPYEKPSKGGVEVYRLPYLHKCLIFRGLRGGGAVCW